MVKELLTKARLIPQACAVLEATLEAVGAKALVVGHTPQQFGANW